jgi:hypothetical protein
MQAFLPICRRIEAGRLLHKEEFAKGYGSVGVPRKTLNVLETSDHEMD